MTVTAATITCRKCRVVGIQNFRRGPVYVAGGDCLDVISCQICGDWYASKPRVEKMERAVSPTEKGHGGMLTQPCTVSGCPGRIDPTKNQSGLCNSCHHKLCNWTKNGSKSLAPIIRTATGYITRAAYLAAQPQEVTHVEITQSLPCLAPPAPETPAISHPPRHIPQLRRDDHQGVSELAQLLAESGLLPGTEIIASWSPDERREVKEFCAALQTTKRFRHTPLMPDVLCPIYDATYAERRA